MTTARTTNPKLGNLTYFNSTGNNVQTEDIDFDGNLWNIGIPILGVDSGNFALSLGPKNRVVTIAGFFSGTIAELLAFRSEIETELNSAAQIDKTYTTSDGDTFTVLIRKSLFKKDLSSPNQSTYIIELLSTNNLLN